MSQLKPGDAVVIGDELLEVGIVISSSEFRYDGGNYRTQGLEQPDPFGVEDPNAHKIAVRWSYIDWWEDPAFLRPAPTQQDT